jgi:peptide/nickel transport system ATP-binding protein
MTLVARDISKVFAGRGRSAASVHAVREASLELAPGQTVGLVGQSGSGKSTLARIVLGLLPPTGGQVIFDDRPTSEFGRADWARFRHQVQAVFQDPRQSLNWRLDIESIVTEPLRNYGVGDRRQRHIRAAELLDQVQVSAKLLARRPADVSGGQLQRVAIARALALAPGYLVCDEPLSALDVSVQAGIVNLLLDLQQTQGLAMLFISHDLGIVRHLSDRVLVMRRGEIVESASAEEFYAGPSHPYSRELVGLTAAPEPSAAERPPADAAGTAGTVHHTQGPPATEPIAAQEKGD